MKYSEVFNEAVMQLIQENHEEARIDAWLLMEAVSGFSRTAWFLHNDEIISTEQYNCFRALVERLLNNEPVSYILGTREFMGLEFNVNRDVLIPRQDTENLVEEVLMSFDNRENVPENPVRILDLCTGSGCIAISIKKFLDDKGISSEVIASDISEKALSVAKGNAEKNGIDVSFVLSDMFESINHQFDIIVSNPPYIPTNQLLALDKKVLDFEPKGALHGGDDGLEFYRIIAEQSVKHLNECGKLFLEIGFDQGESVPEILAKNGFKNIEVLKDYNGLDRVVKALL